MSFLNFIYPLYNPISAPPPFPVPSHISSPSIPPSSSLEKGKLPPVFSTEGLGMACVYSLVGDWVSGSPERSRLVDSIGFPAESLSFWVPQSFSQLLCRISRTFKILLKIGLMEVEIRWWSRSHTQHRSAVPVANKVCLCCLPMYPEEMGWHHPQAAGIKGREVYSGLELWRILPQNRIHYPVTRSPWCWERTWYLKWVSEISPVFTRKLEPDQWLIAVSICNDAWAKIKYYVTYSSLQCPFNKWMYDRHRKDGKNGQVCREEELETQEVRGMRVEL